MNALIKHIESEQLPERSGGETASQAVASQARALVEARYVMALRCPRDIDVVRERLLKECQRPSFARVAIYRKPIGNGVTGPSIRFAEAALRCMTNITVETMTVYDDREKRIVRVTVTDLEANLPYSQDVTIEKTVERKSPKQGDVVIRTRKNSRNESVSLIEATEDDILNKQNALISKAIRTLGLRLVPGDLIDEALYIVTQTQNREDAKDPDAARLQLFDHFGELGIKVSQIKDYLGHDGSTLTPKELGELRGLYAAIRDGEASWSEAMERRKPQATAKPEGGTLSELAAQVAAAATTAAKPIDPRTSEGGKAEYKRPVGDPPMMNDEPVPEPVRDPEPPKAEAADASPQADAFAGVE